VLVREGDSVRVGTGLLSSVALGDALLVGLGLGVPMGGMLSVKLGEALRVTVGVSVSVDDGD
jgi:hypothetical protein